MADLEPCRYEQAGLSVVNCQLKIGGNSLRYGQLP